MEKKFEFVGSAMYYQVFGTGQPVMLLHGFAEDSNIWKDQIPSLMVHSKVILPDLPGSGKSGVLNKAEVSIEEYAHCLNAILENEKIESLILLGHSMGGYITLAFAELYPDKLKAFGFVHSSAFADNEEKKSGRKKGIALIEEYGAFPFLKNMMPGLFSESFKKQHPEKVSAFIEQGKNFSNEVLIQYYSAMMNRPDRAMILRNSTVPVLFIMGDKDVAAPLSDLLQQVHLPKISYIHILKDAGHMSMLEAPEKLAEYLVNFIGFCNLT